MQTGASTHEAEVQQEFQTREVELRNEIHEALARKAAAKAEVTAELEKLYDPRVYTWFDALVSAKSPPGSSCAFVELDVALVCESDGGYRVASLRRPSLSRTTTSRTPRH